MIDLRLGDCLEVMKTIPDKSVDLVLTDPPYPKKFEYVWEILANNSSRLLKTGGSLITLLGHYQLDTVIKIFDGKLRYWWICDMPQRGRTHLCGKMVSVAWKPALWYVKERLNPKIRKMPTDMFWTKNQGKENHKWEQNVEWCKHYIEKLSFQSETVLDPFMGSGTTGVACKELGRNFIGIEISPEYFKIAERRINQTMENLL